ncbi:MAG: DUF434 domain-containing protein [Pirellulaceae bacterium]
MPDKRTHRGAHPEDQRLFAPEAWPALRAATRDLHWLLSHGYSGTSALKLVGDRHTLDARQRIAVARCAAPDTAIARRREHELSSDGLVGQELWIDGYNVLTSVEAALGGGVILKSCDGCFRDMASMHGSYRQVCESRPALGLIGETLADWGPVRIRWLLDAPVSNSGRLRQLLHEIASARGWAWNVDLVRDPDGELLRSNQIAATSDSRILDGVGRWVNLVRCVVEARVPSAWLVDLSVWSP